jgi:hypothetical protein
MYDATCTDDTAHFHSSYKAYLKLKCRRELTGTQG